MTNLLSNKSSLNDVIIQNNISLEFLKSSLDNEMYYNSEFKNYFQLLQFSEDELLILFGESTMIKLKTFIEKHNCFFSMFEDFKMEDFIALTNPKIRLEDLNPEEKTLSLVLIKCLVNNYANDMDLGREIRKIFNEIQS